MPKWLFWLALFFTLFLIYTQPNDAGTIAGNFGQFAVDLLNAVGEFLTGLVGGASGSVDHTHGLTDPAVTDGGATFTHTHDGVTHTHTG